MDSYYQKLSVTVNDEQFYSDAGDDHESDTETLCEPNVVRFKLLESDTDRHRSG